MSTANDFETVRNALPYARSPALARIEAREAKLQELIAAARVLVSLAYTHNREVITAGEFDRLRTALENLEDV